MADLDDVILDEFKARELEILGLMAAGCSNQEIAERLFITKETVRWYNKQIYSKLGTSRRTEAIAKAQRVGLITDLSAPSPAEVKQAQTHNLPTLSTPFLGRDSELALLHSLVSDRSTPIITILGPGGIGKTRLSIELGHRSLDQFKDGVYLFELASLSHPDEIINTVVDTLKLPISKQKSRRDLFFDHCQHKNQLLIFDNFEHLLDGATLIDELSRTAPHTAIVITTRERLNLYGETVFELSGLQQEAAELFEASATSMQAGFKLAAPDRKAVEEIISLVGGLPLAIIMAASWVDSLSVSEIAAEIRQDIDILTTDMRNLPERQRSIRRVLESSWRKLSPTEREACMRLAVFQGGISRAAAKQVAQAGLPILKRLNHKSFIQRTAERRYDIHPLVHQFTLDKLAESGLEPESRARHLAYFNRYIPSVLAAVDHGDYVSPLNEAELEQDNIRAALAWGFDNDAADQATELVLAMRHYWSIRAYTAEALTFFSRALNRPQVDHVRARLLKDFGQFLHHDQLFEAGEKAARDILATAEQTQDLDLEFEALDALIPNLNHQQKSEAIVQHAQRMLDLAERDRSREKMAGAMLHLATAYMDLGMPEKSIEFETRALQLAREAEDELLISQLTYALALDVLSHKGDTAVSRRLLEESLEMARRHPDAQRLISRLTALAGVLIPQSELDEAKALLDEATDLAEVLSLPERTFWVRKVTGDWFAHQGRWEEALALYRRALCIGRDIENRYFQFHAQLALTYGYIQNDLPDQAIHFLKGSIELFQTHRPQIDLSELLICCAELSIEHYDFEQGAHFWRLIEEAQVHDPVLDDRKKEIQAQLQTHCSPDLLEAPCGDVESELNRFLNSLSG